MMRITPSLLTLVFILVDVSELFSSDSMDQTVHETLDLMYNVNRKAIDLSNEITALNPMNPQGHFLTAAAYFWIMTSLSLTDEEGDKFEKKCHETITVAERRLKQQKDDIDAQFYLASAYGYLGRFQGLRGSWMKAFWYGRKSKNLLEEVIQQEPEYYDAYLGLGIYHYYTDTLPKFIQVFSFLLGLEGDAEKGLQELKIANKQGIFSQIEAALMLGDIAFNFEQDYEKSIEIFSELSSRFPNNPIFSIYVGSSYRHMEQYEQAVMAYEQTYKAAMQVKSVRWAAESQYWLGHTYQRMGDCSAALLPFRKAMLLYEQNDGQRERYYSQSIFEMAECHEREGEINYAIEAYQSLAESKSTEKTIREKVKGKLKYLSQK